MFQTKGFRVEELLGRRTISLEHLEQFVNDFNERFSDLKRMALPGCIAQPFLADLTKVASNVEEELATMQHSVVDEVERNENVAA